VVLDILPPPDGKLLGSSWYQGKTDTRSFSWTYREYVEDTEDLAVVAFLQDRENGKILQADADYLTPQVGIEKSGRSNPNTLFVYPNPARDQVYINLGVQNNEEGWFEITDLTGKVVKKEIVPPGYFIYQLDISRLTEGIYILQWIESGVCKGRTMMVRIR